MPIFGVHVMSLRKLLESDPYFVVPRVVKEMSTKHVITTDLIHGVPLDRCKDLDQDERNMVLCVYVCVCVHVCVHACVHGVC